MNRARGVDEITTEGIEENVTNVGNARRHCKTRTNLGKVWAGAGSRCQRIGAERQSRPDNQAERINCYKSPMNDRSRRDKGT